MRPSWQFNLLAGGVLSLATLLSYLPAIRAGFVWDDTAMLTTNLFVQLPAGLYYIWASTALPDYFPLTYTSLWLEWRLWGNHPLGYHLSNVLLHVGSALVLWRVLLVLRIPGAWFGALIFALHPVHVQSVAWIAERKNTLCMIFFLLSLLWYVRWEQGRKTNGTDPAGNGANSKWYWRSLAAFLCALLSKTAVVMLPLMLILYHWWRQGWQAAGPVSTVNRPWRKDAPASSQSEILEARHSKIQRPPRAADSSRHRFHDSHITWVLFRLVPFFTLSLILGLVTVWFQAHRAIGDEPVRSADFLTRLAAAGRALWSYLGKLFVPVNLTFIYPQWEVNARSWIAWLPWAGFLALAACFWWQRHRWGRHALFALGWFVLSLLPVLGFVDIYFHRYAPVADHWAYFATPGLIAWVVGVAAYQLRRLQSERVARLLPILGLIVAGGMGVATWRQAGIYQNLFTLWHDTLKKNPACWLAHTGLGNLYANAGRIEEARHHFARALALKPDAVETLNNFASMLLEQGRATEAIGYLQKALDASPRSAMAHYNLGNALDQLGQPEAAERHFRRALELDPTHAEAHNNLGCLLYAAGRKQEAAEAFTSAITLQPDYAEALNNLAAIFLESGRIQQAESLLWEAVRHKPAYADAWLNLGNTLLRQGRLREAAGAYQRVLQQNPTHPQALCRLGTALWQEGNAPAALEALHAALELQPDLAEAHHQLGLIRANQQRPAAALFHLRRAVELRPDWPEALADLALTLASTPGESDRNGPEALRLASRAVELTGRTNYLALDALAAARAETGAYAEAAAVAALAAHWARTAGDTNRADQIELRLKLYEAGKPYRR